MSITTTLDRLPGLLALDAARIEQAINDALGATAEGAVHPIRGRVPVAFGELRESVQAADIFHAPKTISDAPHAGAVEVGSRPHTPDFEALVRWVKLRGMQGISNTSGHRPNHLDSGPTTASQALRVAEMIKSHEVGGSHLPVDAAEQVARAIAKGIEEHGTPPHWFVRSSLPEIRTILDSEVRKHIKP